MTAEEIRKKLWSGDSKDAAISLMKEIAAQLAEHNELTRKGQELAQKQLEIIEKDFAMRSDPTRYVSDVKKAFEQMISGAVAVEIPPPAPTHPVPPTMPRRGRH